jgi:hypothetical protein
MIFKPAHMRSGSVLPVGNKSREVAQRLGAGMVEPV